MGIPKQGEHTFVNPLLTLYIVRTALGSEMDTSSGAMRTSGPVDSISILMRNGASNEVFYHASYVNLSESDQLSRW